MSNGEETTKTNRNVWNFYEDAKGEYRWRCSDLNGKVLFISAEGYVKKSDAEACARRAGWSPE